MAKNETIAEAVVKIHKAMEELKASGLREDFVVDLLQLNIGTIDNKRVPKKTIKVILNGLDSLAEYALTEDCRRQHGILNE